MRALESYPGLSQRNGGTAASRTGRRHIAVGGSGGRCLGCDSCKWVAASRSSDRSAAGFPVDCSSGPHRCGPTPMRGVRPAKRPLRHRSHSSPTALRRDTPGCSDPGDHRSVPRRTRATVPYSTCVGSMPDMRCCSRSFGCASRELNRNRDTVSCCEATTGYRQQVVAAWSLLSGLNR